MSLSAGHLRLESSLAAHLAVHGCELVMGTVGSRTAVEQTQHLRAGTKNEGTGEWCILGICKVVQS